MASTAERAQQPQRPRPRFRLAAVRHVERLTPRLVRVTLAGPELAGFELPAPTQHVKLILPEPGQEQPVLPDPSLPRGESEPGQPRPLMRTYTIRRYDKDAQELDIEFSLHAHGSASEWAAAVQPGRLAALAGPGGRRYAPDLASGTYLLAGDETALPAIATLLEQLPGAVAARVYAEVEDDADQLAMTSPARLDVTWLARSRGESLLDAFRTSAAPSGDYRLWLACEAGLMRQIRRHVLEDWRLDPAAVLFRGYWKVGERNYRDSDYGED